MAALLAINSENQKNLASLRSLQRERPQNFVRELFNRLDDYSWPWTWVVSAQYRQAVNDYSQTAYKNNDVPTLGRLAILPGRGAGRRHLRIVTPFLPTPL